MHFTAHCRRFGLNPFPLNAANGLEPRSSPNSTNFFSHYRVYKPAFAWMLFTTVFALFAGGSIFLQLHLLALRARTLSTTSRTSLGRSLLSLAR